MSVLKFTEGLSADTPDTNQVSLYAKADGLLYSKDDAGTETGLSGGSVLSFPLPLSIGGTVVSCVINVLHYTQVGNRVTFAYQLDITLTAGSGTFELAYPVAIGQNGPYLITVWQVTAATGGSTLDVIGPDLGGTIVGAVSSINGGNLLADVSASYFIDSGGQ